MLSESLNGENNIPPEIELFQSSKYFLNIVTPTQEVCNLIKNVNTTKACGHVDMMV